MKRILALIVIFAAFQMNAQIIRKGRTHNGGGGQTIREVAEPGPFEFTKQSMFSLSITDIIFTNLTAKYDYFRKDGMVGFQIPFSFNLGGVPDSGNYRVNNAGSFLSARNRIFQTGFNFNYYLNGQDKVSPFVGLSLAAGWFYYWKYNYSTTPGGPYYSYNSEKLIGNNYSLAFDAGFLFNPKETLTFTLKAGVGLRRYATIYQEYTYPFFLGDVSVGFKF